MGTTVFTFNFLVANRADDSLEVGSIRVTRTRFGLLFALAMVWWPFAGPTFTDGFLFPWPGYLPLATALYALLATALYLLAVLRSMSYRAYSAAAIWSAMEFENRQFRTDPFIKRAIFIIAILGALSPGAR